MPPSTYFLYRSYKHYLHDYRVCMSAYWVSGELYELESAMYYLRQAQYFCSWYVDKVKRQN